MIKVNSKNSLLKSLLNDSVCSMKTYNFEQEIVNLGDSMLIILSARKHVYGDPKHHIETNQMVYAANQLTSFYLSPSNTEGFYKT